MSQEEAISQRLDRWSPREIIDFRKLNQGVDAHNRLESRLLAVEQQRPRPIFRIRYGVPRSFPAAVGQILLVTIIDVNDDGQWILPADITEPVWTEPNIVASRYTAFLRPLDNEQFPVVLAGTDIHALPIYRVGQRHVVMHHSTIVYPDPLPSDMHHTECYLQEGAGEVVWV